MRARLESLRSRLPGLAGKAELIAKSGALAALYVYRLTLSPFLVVLGGQACRFTPSCSEYAGEAIAEHGVRRGGALAVRRLLRCRPGGGWGYDPVSPAVPSTRKIQR